MLCISCITTSEGIWRKKNGNTTMDLFKSIVFRYVTFSSMHESSWTQMWIIFFHLVAYVPNIHCCELRKLNRMMHMHVEQCCMYPLKCFMVPAVLCLLIPMKCSKTHLFRSCVALSGKNRILGVAAKNQMVTNMKNTIYGFKRLLGRKYNDPHVQQELKYLPFGVIQQPNGSIGIKVCLLRPMECVFLACR